MYATQDDEGDADTYEGRGGRYNVARYTRISIGLEDEAARGHAEALEPSPQQTYEERLLLKEERKIRIRGLRQCNRPQATI